MNPLYNQLMNQSGMQFNNPMQKMMYIMQAMQNPAQFVKQHIPDIPDEIQNNPNFKKLGEYPTSRFSK